MATEVIIRSPEVTAQQEDLQYTDFDDDQTANLLCTLPNFSPPPTGHTLRSYDSPKTEVVLVLPESPTRNTKNVYTKLRQNRKYYREEDEDEDDEKDEEMDQDEDDEDDDAVVDEEDDEDYNGPIEESDEEEEDDDEDDGEFVEETHSRKIAVIERDVQSKSEKVVEVTGDAYWNDRGYEVCGHVNRHGKPCQRIGNCPFHSKSKKRTKAVKPASVPASRSPPIKKGPFKQGWTQDEHIRFLKGLQIFGRGSWKEISVVVGTRTPTQIQVHAHRYFLRQKQGDKNKKSIHDFNLHDLAIMEKKMKEKKH
eukprot:TRINITY_DN1165_c0_g1_i1.p1 TRINITY_DN1165_c0_g1~~TRINITY_DN1165_c0_g1_i1.p1  ORF type:complete len:309 (+),score=97.48 TRINITY_DN1165_c0_g1_i1:268-1194(+)